MDQNEIRNIIEAAMLAAGRPLGLDQLRSLFGDEHAPPKQEIRAAIDALRAEYAGRGITVNEVASGFRIEVRSAMGPWLARLWEERPQRYSRALMETLAIVAYRQPVTRGDVEEIRGVAVTTNIIRTLLERGWIKVVGYRDVPGKPAMYGTTREFLDYFGLRQLEDLPSLPEIRDLDKMTAQLELPDGELGPLGEGDEDRDGHGPLVSALPSGLPDEPATVSSIEDARLAAAPIESTHARDEAGDEPIADNVIPLKAR
jgi:segregation and condensation protein B